MSDEIILITDFHPATELGDSLTEALAPCLAKGVATRRERLSLDDAADGRTAPCLELIAAHDPRLIFLILFRQQLGRARSLVEAWKKRWPDVPLIAIADVGDPVEVFGLFEHGMADYITPPLRAVEILPRVWRLLSHARRGATILGALMERVGLSQLVGESPAFLSEARKIPLVAKCDVSVLITGETGTGKELCARAVHYLSPRASQPFVPVNCGAIPFELVENELFGHERGAFTGAVTAQGGLIQAADAGTLFLDEIDSMPPFAQVKLLRFLQEKEYRPLGSAKTLKADVRVIAATNNDCEQAVRAGRLRQDLFYRLNIIPLRLPPLRERRSDVPLLARYFLDKYAAEFGKDGLRFDDEAALVLALHDWPGNVRELENAVERAVALCEQGVITPQHLCLPRGAADDEPQQGSFREAKASFVAQFERTYLQKLLLAHRGNITRAAQAARKNRRALWQLIHKYHIDVRSLRAGEPAD